MNKQILLCRHSPPKQLLDVKLSQWIPAKQVSTYYHPYLLACHKHAIQMHWTSTILLYNVKNIGTHHCIHKLTGGDSILLPDTDSAAASKSLRIEYLCQSIMEGTQHNEQWDNHHAL